MSFADKWKTLMNLKKPDKTTCHSDLLAIPSGGADETSNETTPLVSRKLPYSTTQQQDPEALTLAVIEDRRDTETVPSPTESVSTSSADGALAATSFGETADDTDHMVTGSNDTFDRLVMFFLHMIACFGVVCRMFETIAQCTVQFAKTALQFTFQRVRALLYWPFRSILIFIGVIVFVGCLFCFVYLYGQQRKREMEQRPVRRCDRTYWFLPSKKRVAAREWIFQFEEDRSHG